MRIPISALSLIAVLTPLSAQEPLPTVTPADYGKFEQVRQVALSPDGRFLCTAVSRVDGTAELRLTTLGNGTTEIFEQGSGPVFSADGKWLAWREVPSEKQREKATQSKKSPPAKSALRDLVAGETHELDNVASFSFSEGGKFIALQRSAKGSKGSAVVVRNLENGQDTAFGNVGSWRWCETAPMLALAVSHDDRLGNGVHLFHAGTGTLRVLHSGEHDYQNLTWREDAHDLAALAATDRDDDDTTFEVLAWTGLHSKVQTFTFDHLKHEGFPGDQRVVAHSGIRWSDDGERLFFGIQDWRHRPAFDDDNEDDAVKPADEPAAKTDKAQASHNADDKPGLRGNLDKPSNVEIWHAKDIDIQPRQKITLGQDRRRADLVALWLRKDHVVRLGDDLTERVRLAEGQKAAIGLDNTPYEAERRFSATRYDAYRIDVSSGDKERFLSGTKFVLGTDPKGRYVAYVQEGELHTFDLQTGRHTSLTQGLDDEFINQERVVLTDENSPYGVAGWSADGRWLFAHSRYDIWRLRPDGRKAERLTNGAEERIRHRLIQLDPDADHWRNNGPWTVSLYGDTTKKRGYGIARPGRKVEQLTFKDARVDRLVKAGDADVYAWLEQRFDASPTVHTGGKGLAKATPRQTTNDFMAKHAWGRSELVTYENARGENLQGALFYPADYEAGKRYPMIVYIYEMRSQVLHDFQVPNERRPYNTAVFTQNGYFVFQPDITYRAQNPGLSALECVVPAVRQVAARDDVREDQVGLVGHSWGAYQTAFLATQTDVFAACVAGAPLTNMMSMSMSIYWNSGQTDAYIFHESQGRMDRPFWQDVDTYIANSPIFHVDKMDTPLLVAFGDDDGAVDFNQGVELYNAARLAQKPFVMLVYPGENHSLRQKENQVDYHWRVREWFDHYLKGVEAPKWISDGTPWVERQNEIEDRKRSKKAPKKKSGKKTPADKNADKGPKPGSGGKIQPPAKKGKKTQKKAKGKQAREKKIN